MDGDTIAFGLLIGLPILVVSWMVAKLLLAWLSRGLAIALCLALIVAWPVYYIVMTVGDPGFAEGLPLILFTSPAMVLGLVLAMGLGSRQARRR